MLPMKKKLVESWCFLFAKKRSVIFLISKVVEWIYFEKLCTESGWCFFVLLIDFLFSIKKSLKLRRKLGTWLFNNDNCLMMHIGAVFLLTLNFSGILNEPGRPSLIMSHTIYYILSSQCRRGRRFPVQILDIFNETLWLHVAGLFASLLSALISPHLAKVTGPIPTHHTGMLYSIIHVLTAHTQWRNQQPLGPKSVCVSKLTRQRWLVTLLADDTIALTQNYRQWGPVDLMIGFLGI